MANTQLTINEDIASGSNYRRSIFKECLIGSMFLAIFALIDFFYTELYLDSVLEALGCVILLALAYIEKKNGLNALAIICGLLVISTIIGSGIFSNNVEDSGISWIALIPLLSFFLLGQKLGLKVSLVIGAAYIMALTNVVIQYPEKGFNVNSILGGAGAFLCSIMLSMAYEKNRTSVIQLLAEQTKTDSLTSLLNRRGLIAYFENLALLSKKNKTDLYLLVLDLDNFKSINDNFGHDIGDLVIKETAHAAKASLRSADCIARIGGEEFTAVLSNLSLEDVLSIAEKIRLTVENLDIQAPFSESIIKVTVSIGITKSSKDKTVFSDFFKVADKALYEAKNNGRNQIVFKK